MLEFTQYTEGVNDPAIFKAIFLAGGPGSGKSFIVGQTALTSLGFKVVNSDNAFERALAKADMKSDPETIFSPAGQAIRGKAKAITNKQMMGYINGRLGLVIDGTGKDYKRIERQRTTLAEIGYDTAMIFVNTDLETAALRDLKRKRKLGFDTVEKMWNETQKNLGAYQRLFGNRNFIVVDNSDSSDYKKETLRVYKDMKRFAERDPKSPAARKWIEKQRAK
jgi:shikimate kinase